MGSFSQPIFDHVFRTTTFLLALALPLDARVLRSIQRSSRLRTEHPFVQTVDQGVKSHGAPAWTGEPEGKLTNTGPDKPFPIRVPQQFQDHGLASSEPLQMNSSDSCTFSYKEMNVLPNTPYDALCPASCPFSQTTSDDASLKVCIVAESCADFNRKKRFADPRTQRCQPTCGEAPEHHIPGCEECAGEGICAKCGRSVFGDLVLSADGTKCFNPFHKLWVRLYWTVFVMVVLITWYCVMLWRRTQYNKTVLEEAFRHRLRCLPTITEPLRSVMGLYSLSTNVHKVDVAGKGVMLYFNWIVMISVLALVLMLGTLTGYVVARGSAVDELGQVHVPRVFPDFLQEERWEKADTYKFVMSTTMVLLSVFSTLYCLVCAFAQLRISNTLADEGFSQSAYAVEVDGLPADLTNTDTLANEVAMASGESVEGAVVAFDFSAVKSTVSRALEKWIQDSQERHGSGDASGFSRQTDKTPWWHLPFLDKCIADRSIGETSVSEEVDVQHELEGLKGSGRAFVVFSTTDGAAHFRQKAMQDPHLLDGLPGTGAVRVLSVYDEPVNVPWHNYGGGSFGRNMRLWGSFWAVVFVVTTWMHVYLPFAVEIITQVHSPAKSTSNILGMVMNVPNPGKNNSSTLSIVLSALIGLGNLFATKAIEALLAWVNFRRRDNRDVTALGLSYMATVLGTAANVWMTYAIVHDLKLDSAFTDHSETGYGRALAEQLFWLAVPGYLAVPYFFQPMVEVAFPHWFTKWIVRSKFVSQRTANLLLEPSDFEIHWRYANVLHNLTICCLMLFFFYHLASWTFMFLIIFLFLVYWQDKIKMLRFAALTPHTSSRLSDAFAAWLVFPTTALASVACWWWLKVYTSPYSWEITMSCVIVGHAFMYLAVLSTMRCLASKAPSSQMTYKETLAVMADKGHLWTYFNTNPVHCLRTKYLNEGKECEPYVRGLNLRTRFK